MREESDEQARPLRTGLTTGTCATACSLAAAQSLLLGVKEPSVEVVLPKRQNVQLTIEDYQTTEMSMTASTIKDAGDDPDVTHQALILSTIRLIDSGIVFKAGQGVGTVTREGLVLEVGEPAINPVPRKMITEHLQQLAQQHNYQGGFEVTVSVQDGEALALKTMNSRLGIMGGLSILGTTGIVRPFSCSAYIASIHRGIDVAQANGCGHLAASTGNASEQFIANHYALPDMALIEMGDFAGAVLKYLKRHPVEKLSISAGFGKLTKLANQHLDLHSRASSIDFECLSEWASELGADQSLQQQIQQANTSLQALKLCQQQSLPLANLVCEKAQNFAQQTVGDQTHIEVFATDRKGKLLAKAL